MKWYMCWAAGSVFRTDHDWENLIRAALYSARANTTLEPVIVIDGAPTRFTRELEAAGAQVVFHRLSFRDALEAHYASHGPNLHVAIGTFLRFDIPLIERAEEEYVLYTDCDVLFLRQPEFLPTELPHYFAAAPQFTPDDYADMNAGVMLINLRHMRAAHAQLVEYTCGHLDIGLDQEILRATFGRIYTPLRPELNWKPYWGLNPAAVILHWHGPKPVTVRQYLADGAFRSHADWNALFDRNPEGYRQAERLHADLLLGAAAARNRDATRFLRNFAADGEPFWGEYFAHLAALNEIVAQCGTALERGIFFASQPAPAPDPGLAPQRRNFAYFAALGSGMLEIGFNAGHSALLALTANKSLSYIAVDDLAHGYARPCFDYLRQIFADRIRLIVGDSRNVLRQFGSDVRAFDLACVDGGSDLACTQSDLAELSRILPAGTPLLVQDAGQAPVRAAVLGAIAGRRLRQLALPVPAADQLFLEVVRP